MILFFAVQSSLLFVSVSALASLLPLQPFFYESLQRSLIFFYALDFLFADFGMVCSLVIISAKFYF